MTGDAVGKLDHRSRIQLEEEFGGEIVGCRAVETKKRERESLGKLTIFTCSQAKAKTKTEMRASLSSY